MSRASRRLNRESAMRANNAKEYYDNSINRHRSSAESKEARLERMKELYKQNKQN